MKIVPIFVLYAVVFVVACFDLVAAQMASSNGTKKLQISENANPQVFGVAFDEITVESNLNIRGKSPTSRTQRTQLFPVKKSNITNDNNKPNENKPNDVKLANA